MRLRKGKKAHISTNSFTNLHCIRDGQACIGWRYLILHEDNEKCHGGDKGDADEVKANRQPAHCTTEEVVGGLVGVQELLISLERKKRQGEWF